MCDNRQLRPLRSARSDAWVSGQAGHATFVQNEHAAPLAPPLGERARTSERGRASEFVRAASRCFRALAPRSGRGQGATAPRGPAGTRVARRGDETRPRLAGLADASRARFMLVGAGRRSRPLTSANAVAVVAATNIGLAMTTSCWKTELQPARQPRPASARALRSGKAGFASGSRRVGTASSRCFVHGWRRPARARRLRRALSRPTRIGWAR